MRKSSLAAGVFAVALGAGPALAATTTTSTPPPPSTTNQPAPGTATANQANINAAANKPPPGTATINEATSKPPNHRNPILARNGDARIGKMIGTDVYNKDNQKLGSVDGVLVDQKGVAHVVIALNGSALNNKNNTNNNNANNANFVSTNHNVTAKSVRANNPNYVYNHDNNNRNNDANKKVVVPWRSLQFGNANLSGNNKILMPDTTIAKLESLGAYSYNKTKQQSAAR
ncbi:MAG: PRC-barrel domain-containing protein [Gammaproteobacteria bacterium]